MASSGVFVFALLVVTVLSCNWHHASAGIENIRKLRVLAAENNVTCVIAFGDSGLDPGNNNNLQNTIHKGNFLPYGKDFFNSTPTGRFSNGRLATDFIAEALGYRNMIKAYLDPHLEDEDLLHGVSFASGGSGYDNLTVKFSNVISLWKQLEYFREYKVRVSKLVGKKKTKEILRNAVYVLSMGTNDFLQNYYVDPTRSKQFTLDQYQRYLISCMSRYIQDMHRLGVRRLAVTGMEPFGCMPLIKTLKGTNECDNNMNQVALSFNIKLKSKLASIKTTTGMTINYVDVYGLVATVLQNPTKYGFTESKKGCCGTGLSEFGMTVKGLTTCTDPSKYIYWDAVHFTEKMYSIIADQVIQSIIESF